MKIRGLVSVLIIALFLLPFSLAAGFTSPDLSVTLVSQTPDPVEPGETIKVKFKVENGGKQTTDDVIITLKPTFPFSLYGDQAVRNIGSLRHTSVGSDAVYVEYTLKVDENAVEKLTELELEIKHDSSVISYVNDEFQIDIQTRDAIIDIYSIKTDPMPMPVGEPAKIMFSIKNTADSDLQDIVIDADFSATDLPLAAYGMSSQRIISRLNAQESKALSLQIISEPDATAGLYKIPVNLTYTDEQGTSYKYEETFAIRLGSTPNVKPFIRKSTVLQENAAGTVTLTIANAGTTDVKFAELTLLPSQDYQLVSTSEYVYLGDIDSDDTETEEFEIFINDDVEVLKMPIQLAYLDANNQQFTEEFDLELQLYSSSTLKKFGVIEGSSSSFFVIIILLAAGGFFYYKRYYKKRKMPPKK